MAKAFFCKSPSIKNGVNERMAKDRMASAAGMEIERSFRDTILYNGMANKGKATLSTILMTEIINSSVTVKPKNEMTFTMEAQK